MTASNLSALKVSSAALGKPYEVWGQLSEILKVIMVVLVITLSREMPTNPYTLNRTHQEAPKALMRHRRRSVAAARRMREAGEEHFLCFATGLNPKGRKDPVINKVLWV